MATRLSKFRAVTVLSLRLIERHTLATCAAHLGIGVPAVHAWERRLIEQYGKHRPFEWRQIELQIRDAWDPAWSWTEFVKKELDRVG